MSADAKRALAGNSAAGSPDVNPGLPEAAANDGGELQGQPPATSDVTIEAGTHVGPPENILQNSATVSDALAIRISPQHASGPSRAGQGETAPPDSQVLAVPVSAGKNGGSQPPPKSHRFKPGQSGNPRGRPKSRRNLKTDLANLLDKRIAVHEDGKTRIISGQEALLLSLYSKAVRGDHKAQMSILTMVMKFQAATETSSEQDEVSANDEGIIKDYLRRIGAIPEGEEQ